MRNPLTLNKNSVWIGFASALCVSVAPLPALGQAIENNVALFGTNNPDLLAPVTAGGLNQPNFLNESVIAPSVALDCDRSILLDSESCLVDPDAAIPPSIDVPQAAVAPKVQPSIDAPVSALAEAPVQAPITAPRPVFATRTVVAAVPQSNSVVAGAPNGEVLAEYLPVQPVSLLGADESPYLLPPNVAETASLGEGVDFRPYASLRGGVRFGNGGSRNFIYETEVGADIDFYSASGDATLNSALLLGKEPNVSLSFTSFKNGFSGQYDLSELTGIDVAARFDIERESLGDEDLPTNTKTAPVFVTGSVTVGLAQQFGQFALTPNVTVERVGFGKTELTNGTELTNESRQYWRGEIGLRARYDITPRVAAIGGVFVDGTWFDAIDPVSGLTRDRSSAGLQAGFEADWTEHVKVGASATVTVESYRDGSANSDPNWLFDGFATYQPNQDMTFSATLSSQVTPSEVTGTKSQIVRSLGLASSYLATQDVTVRTSLDGEHTTFVGPDTSTAKVKVGAGLDYLMSDHVTGTLDVSADWTRDVNNLVTNEQEIMVGVTIRP